MHEYIDREDVLRCIKESRESIDWGQIEDGDAFLYYSACLYRTIASAECIPTADVVEVVRCQDCVNYVESEEVNGEKMCVRDADWSIEDGCYYGFTEYPSPDWFCADGKKREES